MAGFVVMLMIVMVASGAFMPALDLLAGERERGSLETLCVLPIDRRALFLGKLLLVIVATVLSVVLNVASLALSIFLTVGQMGGTAIAGGGECRRCAAGGVGGLASVLLADPLLYVVALLLLVPLAVTLSAVCLALAGIAASYKEAQNYLTPLLLVVVSLAMVAALGDVTPNVLLDMVPVVGRGDGFGAIITRWRGVVVSRRGGGDQRAGGGGADHRSHRQASCQ